MEGLVAVSPQSFTSFGELLRFLRERVELSQKELAIQVGYHYSYMSRIEKNQRIPDPTTLMARFVPALALDSEPEWTARLLELAGATETKLRSTIGSSRESRPAPAAPLTALPIFDLSSSNLPIILTPLLGRNQEVAALTDLLARENVRLVTVIGPLGVGKTRLAAHIAAQVAGSFAHGPLFVDLTSVTDVDAFLPTLAEALNVQETSDIPLLRSIVASLHPRNLLLVLDNFEQVIRAASHVLSLLAGAPNLKILITSREALHVSGEYEFPLAPLALPEPFESSQIIEEEQNAFEPFTHYAAVQLFLQRAQAVQPAFQLTRKNAAAVIQICRRLDGLPLAIELAAARIKTLDPQTMLQQLDRRLDWLTRGSRDANVSRQTLRGTLEWSYNLLSEPECVLLRRLSVFSGGWTLRAAESVCADSSDTSKDILLRREDILDLLGNLVDKSLVVPDVGAQQARYHLFETVREFGREKLLQADELTEILNRHLMHFAEYAEESERHLDGDEQAKWIAISEKEHNNFRSAIDHSLTPGADLMFGLRIGAAISLFWIERNHFHEGIERLEALLQRAVHSEQEQLKAKMLYRAAAIYLRLFSYNRAHTLCEQSIEIFRALADRRSLASALYYMGNIYLALHNYSQAKTVLEESVSICWSIHFPQQLNMALTSLGNVLDEMGEHERALTITEEALAIAEQIDDTWGMIHALQLLGTINRLNAERDRAIDYFERSLPGIRLIGDRFAEGITLANLSILYNLKEDYLASGHAAERSFALFQSIGEEVQQPFPLRMMGYSAIHAGNIIRAHALILESLKGNRSQAHILGQLACLIALGSYELEKGNAAKAVRLAGIAENYRQTKSYSFLEPDTVALHHLLKTGKEKLGKRVFEQTLKQSQSLRMEDVVAQELPSVI